MIVYDAHAHLGTPEELQLRRQLGLRTVLSCTTPEQVKTACSLPSEIFSFTVGVHPWQASSVPLSSLLPDMEKAPWIGEIGLDSVWCDVPLPTQRRVFSNQLDWAAEHGKGIVLHTKGCEREIARAVADFPHPILVHWYSGDAEALEHFFSLNCFFTIGPDIRSNPCVQAVARRVPDQRILFESDGMDAIQWASGIEQLTQLPVVLSDTAYVAASLRQQDPAHLCQIANGNFCQLFS